MLDQGTPIGRTMSPPRTSAPLVDGVSKHQPQQQTTKRTPKDFIFGKVIGEGSFSTVS